MSTPDVSVVMASYNHASYVRDAIDSVLRQRDVSFEFLVQDDGSIDETAEILEGVRDSRLRNFPKDANEGQSVTTNFLIGQARGEFIAVINSDDVWCDDGKLAHQVEVLRSNPDVGASFTRAQFIDAAGEPVAPEFLVDPTAFDQPNRSRGKWLRRFFSEGNCLCHPSVMVRRSCHERHGLYDTRLRQIPDLPLWVRIVKQHDLHVSDRVMVQFRLLGSENTSAPSVPNTRRLSNEEYLSARVFFDDADESVLRDGFGDLMANPEPLGPRELEVERAALLLQGPKPMQWLAGVRQMHGMLGRPEMRPVLAAYGVDHHWLETQLARYTPFQRRVSAPLAAPPRARRSLLQSLGWSR
jgi:glycosyltransferase involved in cell wall biosynthesis